MTHLASIQTHHPGKDKIRMAEEMFEINGPSGQPHQCLVHEPLVTSILHFQSALPDKSLPEDMLKPLLREIFTALDFMHSEADAIHTGRTYCSLSSALEEVVKQFANIIRCRYSS